MSKRNTSAMKEYNKNRSKEKEQNVIDAINKLRKKGNLFSLSDVCKEAGCSRAYIYKNEELLSLVDKYRNIETKKKIQTKDSKDVLITSLKAEIVKLKRVIYEKEKEESYKNKYEELKAENEQLKSQLEQAYLQKLDVDF